MKKYKITFIGGGYMARSVASGLAQDGYPVNHLFVTNRNSEKLAYFERLGIAVSTDNKIGANFADVVILAVKPYHLAEVCEEIKPIITVKKSLLILLAAGVEIMDIYTWFADDQLPVVRAMPNTAAIVGASATALYAPAIVPDEFKNIAETIFRSVGFVTWLNEEKYMHIATALSGSGPAYLFLVMEAMQQAAVELGLDAEIAKLLTIQTTLGASRIALETNQELCHLRESVSSAKGTTIEALKIFEQGKLQELIAKAINAAYQRSLAIAAEIKKDN